MSDRPGASSIVEIRPEVNFLYEILQELAVGRIQVPRFQRAFVWRSDQMTDLLDSVNRQYPIGSLLVWETEEQIATLEDLGPFVPQRTNRSAVGYLLDGHQRLITLAGALLGDDGDLRRRPEPDSKWEMYWNVKSRSFQHGGVRQQRDDVLFPMTSLLDTVKFFESIEQIRDELGDAASRKYVTEVTALARTFQSYRIPVIRIRDTGLSEAVEIFARLNSRGQLMTTDQMVSALTFRQDEQDSTFDLASGIDRLAEGLATRLFGDIDRNTVLRAILASLDEDIYRTDWSRLTGDRSGLLQERLQVALKRTEISLGAALDFLSDIGVCTSRLLPYGLQLVLLSAFFDRRPKPTEAQVKLLRRWFWVSSFSAWFGGANPSRTGALVREFRKMLAQSDDPTALINFDLDAQALPFPTNFDMRSARTRTLLLVLLAADPLDGALSYRDHAVEQLASQGPAAVGSIYWESPAEMRGNPANRLFRPPSAPRSALSTWIEERIQNNDREALVRAGIDERAIGAFLTRDVRQFLRAREQALVELETRFQKSNGVRPSTVGSAEAPIDTE